VAIVAAGIAGVILGGSRLGVVRAHLLGAAAGAMVLLLSAAAALGPQAGSHWTGLPLDTALLHDRVTLLNATLQTELRRFLGAGEGVPTTLTYLVLGALCWTTGQFSAFSVLRYQRAGPAIAACGTLLFLNEALPAAPLAADRLPVLASLSLFALLAMLLLVRLQLASQGSQWLRRQVTDSPEVRRLYLRAGGAFVVLVVIAATSLTAFARVPAQAVDGGPLREPLERLRDEAARWLTLVAVDVGPGEATTVDDELRVADEWQQGSGVAFVAQVEDDLRGNYWWLSAFADFDGRAWTREDTTTDEVPARELIGVPPDASGAGPVEVAVTLTPRRSSLALGTVLGPSEALAVDRSVRVRSLGDREGLTEITFAEPILRGGSYRVVAAVHDYAAGPSSPTAAELRAARTDYPAWMARYLRVEDGASGPRTVRFASDIAAEASRRGSATPFDLALLMQARLRDYAYATSVAGLCEVGENVPECLLRTRKGFCQHYASTMIMALRELGVPARLANGYLPGGRREDGSYEVPLQALHAWVEVYFPGHGWLRFDPTPGDDLRRFEQSATLFPEGEDMASSSAAPSAPPDEPLATSEMTLEPSPVPAALTPGSGPMDGAVTGVLTIFLVTTLGLALLAAILLARLRRLPDADGSLAYGRIVGLARRLGYGPHPAQTEYEYAESLSDALPAVRAELHVVARARVEQRYGRRALSSEGKVALRRAYARVRTALLRLRWGARRP
jgi:transglutaminase-like putative cysteine protease